jgi:hypothetical protein
VQLTEKWAYLGARLARKISAISTSLNSSRCVLGSLSPDFATCSFAIKSLDYGPEYCFQNSITNQANTTFTGAASASPSDSIDDISYSALDQLAQSVIKLECFLNTLFIADLKELHTNLV